MSNSVIKADNIIKKYGRNYALVGVSVEIEKGQDIRTFGQKRRRQIHSYEYHNEPCFCHLGQVYS